MDQILQLSQTAPLSEHWTDPHSKPLAEIIGNCLSKGHDKQSLLIPFLTIAAYNPSLESCKSTSYFDVQ